MLPGIQDPPQWVETERLLTSCPRDIDILYHKTKPTSQPENPMLLAMYQSWCGAHRLLETDPHIHANAPLWGNDGIRIGGKPIHWEQWKTVEIMKLHQVIKDGDMKPFEELCKEYDLPPSQKWCYLQLRHCLKSCIGARPWIIPASPVVSYLRVWGRFKGVMSGLYGLLERHLFSEPLLKSLRTTWQTRLHIEIKTEDWAELIKLIDRGTREARLKFCLFKTLHNWHWTPAKLHKAGLLHHANCWRCPNTTCDIIHILCDCPSVQSFWTGIGRVLQDVIPIETPLSKPLLLLHDIGPTPDLSRPQRRLLHTALATAKICILRHWRAPTPPTREEWHAAMVQTATYERVIYNLQDQTDIFLQIWTPFLQNTTP